MKIQYLFLHRLLQMFLAAVISVEYIPVDKIPMLNVMRYLSLICDFTTEPKEQTSSLLVLRYY